MARIIKETLRDTMGKEAGLAFAGRLFLVLGIALILCSVIVMIVRAEFFWIAYGGLAALIGIILYIIFSALAEIIRLLKHLCGMAYNGTISGTRQSEIFICSQCRSLTYPDSLKCERCGEEFERLEPEKDPAEGV